MNLPIIQSILHGALRTNIKSDIPYREIANALSNLLNNLDDIENVIHKQLSNYVIFDYEKPILIDVIAPDSYTKLSEDNVLVHLELEIPAPNNPKEKFYQNIINAECQRTKLAHVEYSKIQCSDTDTKSDLKDTLRQIFSFAKSLADDTIHTTIKKQLICLYVELTQMACNLLTEGKDYYSFDDLMFELFQRYPSENENNILHRFKDEIDKEHSAFGNILHSSLPSSQEYEQEKIKTNYDIFIEIVKDYQFEELEMVKCLSNSQKIKLIRLIVESPVGYSVVMLKHIGYFDHLKSKYSMNKENSFKHIGKALQKSPRIIKGNYNVLNPKSNEDASIYNSQSYTQQVSDDYKNLQL